MFQLVTCNHQQLIINVSVSDKLHHSNVLPVSELIVIDTNLRNSSDDMGLHRVENPSLTDKMATLHFYWPPIKECLIFDEDTSKARKVKMTFTSVKGVKTPFTPSSAVREST